MNYPIEYAPGGSFQFLGEIEGVFCDGVVTWDDTWTGTASKVPAVVKMGPWVFVTASMSDDFGVNPVDTGTLTLTPTYSIDGISVGIEPLTLKIEQSDTFCSSFHTYASYPVRSFIFHGYVDGELCGATVTWDVDWEPDSEYDPQDLWLSQISNAPSVTTAGPHVVVSAPFNRAFGGNVNHVAPGVMTLIPTVNHTSGLIEVLDPLTLNIKALSCGGTMWWRGLSTPGGPNMTLVNTDKDWVDVACSGCHIVAIKYNGTMWARGCNEVGQLGTGDTIARDEFVQIGSDRRWRKVFAFGYIGLSRSTFAIAEDGSLWGWGANDGWRLGLGEDTPYITTPRLIATGSWTHVSTGNLLALYCGTATHGIKDGELWGWGCRKTGNGGSSSIPERILCHTNQTCGAGDLPWECEGWTSVSHLSYTRAVRDGAIYISGTLWNPPYDTPCNYGISGWGPGWAWYGSGWEKVAGRYGLRQDGTAWMIGGTPILPKDAVKLPGEGYINIVGYEADDSALLFREDGTLWLTNDVSYGGGFQQIGTNDQAWIAGDVGAWLGISFVAISREGIDFNEFQ